MVAGTSPVTGTVVSIAVQNGDQVAAGRTLCTVESMKMHHDVVAVYAGVVSAVAVSVGGAVAVGDVLVVIDEIDAGSAQGAGRGAGGREAGADSIARADLAEVVERHRLGLDEARPDAVDRRRRMGRRTARENVDDLVDAGSFVEYGPLVVAAQRRRRGLDDLVANTPADGWSAGSARSMASCSEALRRAAWSRPTTTRCSPEPRAR
jgi:pyruvate/2-oxoglutarate dehydrogenase complex dihydrolipoamide acyltransferase (E2) component